MRRYSEAVKAKETLENRGRLRDNTCVIAVANWGHGPGLIQSLSQGFLPGLSAWVEVGGIASSLCPTALLPQPISI
jgi:hypothetical protein